MTLTYADRIMQAIKLALDARMPVIEKKLNDDLANGEGLGTPLVTLNIEITTLPKRGKRVRKVSASISTKWTAAKEFVTVEQVAALALFLCSDNASQITGSNYSIDGGWTAE